MVNRMILFENQFVRLKNENYPYCVMMEINGMSCTDCQQQIENEFNQEENLFRTAFGCTSTKNKMQVWNQSRF